MLKDSVSRAAMVAICMTGCNGGSAALSEDGGPGNGDASFDSTAPTGPTMDASTEAALPGIGVDASFADAGASDAGADAPEVDCTPGATRCTGNSAQTCSADAGWTAAVACVNQSCVAGTCTGQCAPGQAECVGNGVSLCDAGTWSNPSACVNQTCVGSGVDAGASPMTASCQGTCGPGQTSCDGGQPLSCGTAGEWTDHGNACTGSTPVCSAGDCLLCLPGTLRCDNQQPQQCDSTGATWSNEGLACSGSAPVCLNGSCVACNPGDVTCSGQQPLQCGSGGSWENAGAACLNQACVGGMCTGVCAPGATKCTGTSLETCSPAGQWASAPCTGATPYCAAGSCSATPLPPSCAPGGPGMTDCGATAENCCASPLVTGGAFARTYGADGGTDPATVSSFRLDKYEITVGRFRQYVSYLVNGGSPPADGSGKHTHLNGGAGLVQAGQSSLDGGPAYEYGWLSSWWNQFIPTGASAASTWNDNLTCYPQSTTFATWTPTVGSNEDLPLNCLTFAEAYAFCIWDGGFLPSIAEWRYATVGGAEQRQYPWGSQDPGTGSNYAIYGCLFPSGVYSCGGGGNIAPVGHTKRGAGLWGQFDLVGSVGEWSLDFHSTTGFYSPCIDCVDLSSTGYRYQDGFSFADSLSLLGYGNYVYVDPGELNTEFGARCARAP
jgi:formylglycine-generating enzyme required for sulfatase activity